MTSSKEMTAQWSENMYFDIYTTFQNIGVSKNFYYYYFFR